MSMSTLPGESCFLVLLTFLRSLEILGKSRFDSELLALPSVLPVRILTPLGRGNNLNIAARCFPFLQEQQGAAVGWMTVPAFGEWDVKNGAVPDYSMDFSKIREMRKQNKRELSRASLGGDEDLLQQQQQQQQSSKAQPPKSSAAIADDDHRRPLHDDSPTVTILD
jgi:hypothetical protein